MRCLANWEVCGFEIGEPGNEEEGGRVVDFCALAWAGICRVGWIWDLHRVPWIMLDGFFLHRI